MRQIFGMLLLYFILSLLLDILYACIQREYQQEQQNKNQRTAVVRLPQTFLWAGCAGAIFFFALMLIMTVVPNTTATPWVYGVFLFFFLLSLSIVAARLLWKIVFTQNDPVFLYRTFLGRTYQIDYSACISYKYAADMLILKTSQKTFYIDCSALHFERFRDTLTAHHIPCTHPTKSDARNLPDRITPTAASKAKNTRRSSSKTGVASNAAFFEIEYDIMASCDLDGDFPLECLTFLLDLLGIKNNILIRNRFEHREEQPFVLSQYMKNTSNQYYQWPESPRSDYCLWIKEPYESAMTFLDFLKVTGYSCNCIVPNESFQWEQFVENWTRDPVYLLTENQASFLCNIYDEDKILYLYFSAKDYSEDFVQNILLTWEQEIQRRAQAAHMQRTVTLLRSRYQKYQSNQHVEFVLY